MYSSEEANVAFGAKITKPQNICMRAATGVFFCMRRMCSQPPCLRYAAGRCWRGRTIATHNSVRLLRRSRYCGLSRQTGGGPADLGVCGCLCTDVSGDGVFAGAATGAGLALAAQHGYRLARLAQAAIYGNFSCTIFSQSGAMMYTTKIASADAAPAGLAHHLYCALARGVGVYGRCHDRANGAARARRKRGAPSNTGHSHAYVRGA